MQRRDLLRLPALGLASVAALSGPAAMAAPPLTRVRFALPNKAIEPLGANYLIPGQLGYYRQAGLDASFIPLGSVAAAVAALADHRADFAALPASDVLELAAHGGLPDIVAFYEMTYPFKYGIAVDPASPIHSIAQLRGKTIGVANFGTSEYPVGRALLRRAGIDPTRDVHWLAVGEGVIGGVALQHHRIDAFIYWDTGFGQIEAAGIPLRFLPLGPPPDVGGIFLFTSAALLRQRPALATGVGKAVAETSLFIQTNPRAGAYAFIKAFPSAAPKVASLQKQVDALAVPIRWRMPLYRSKDPALARWGEMSAKEWRATAAFLHLPRIADPGKYFTNALIPGINAFDAAAVVAAARHAPQ